MGPVRVLPLLRVFKDRLQSISMEDWGTSPPNALETVSCLQETGKHQPVAPGSRVCLSNRHRQRSVETDVAHCWLNIQNPDNSTAAQTRDSVVFNCKVGN